MEIRTTSYNELLQADVQPAKREEKGLLAVFHEIFPVASFDGRYVLDFVKYQLLPPKRTYQESLYEGETYSCQLQATFRLKDGENVQEEDEVWWRVFNNIDARQDLVLVVGALDGLDHSSPMAKSGSKIGIDATKTWPEEGHSRVWPDEIRMTDEVGERVTARWKELGFE